MRLAIRVTLVGILTAVAVGVMMLTSTMVSLLTVTAVAATTALIMGGTGDPLSTEKDTLPYVQQYLGMAVNNYITPSSTATPTTGIPQGPYNAVAVITPEEWAPQTGNLTLDQSIAIGTANLDNCIRATNCEYNTDVGSAAPAASDRFVVFGYSQSAAIGTFEKRRLAAEFPNGGGPDVSFVFIGNGNRPNGGFLARGPEGFTVPPGLIFAGATFSGPTPTDTQYETVDIAAQYDAWADVPLNPLNLVAVANWYSSYVHYNYKNVNLGDPGIINQGQYGDTTYYMIPTKILPLLTSVTQLPVIGYPVADALDAPLRVLVEAGYDRTISPGQPAPWNPLYVGDPVKVAASFAVSIPTGLDNAFEDTIGIRPFGTERPGPYGVGGPGVTYDNPPETTATTASTSQTLTDAKKAAALNGAQGSSSVTDSSTDVEDSTAVSQSGNELSDSALSDLESLRDSAAEDLAPVAESERSSADPKPQSSAHPKAGDATESRTEDVTESGTVKSEESLNGNATTDAPTADAATTQPSTSTKSSDESKPPARGPRHALPDNATSAFNSTAPGGESTPPARGPRHARPDTATTSKTNAASTKTSSATAGASTPDHDSTSKGSESDSAQ
jgi:PE-PPE domain